MKIHYVHIWWLIVSCLIRTKCKFIKDEKWLELATRPNYCLIKTETVKDRKGVGVLSASLCGSDFAYRKLTCIVLFYMN